MTSFSWVAVVVGSLIMGAGLAGLMVIPRNREPLAVLLGAIGGAITIGAITLLATSSGRSTVTFVAGLIALGGFGGGYALVAALLGSLHRRCSVPFPPAADARDRMLVLIVADVEPASYDPSEVTHQIAELTDAGLPEASLGVLPFFYASHKARYRAVGGTSPESSQAHALSEQVASFLDPERFAGPVLVNCVNGSLLTETIRMAPEHGYDGVIVAIPYIAEPFRIDREKRAVDAARLDSPSVAYTTPLWGSERIAQRLADKIADMAGDSENTGVVLVLHGQPGEREHTHGEFEEQENVFANRVRMMLAERGIEENNVRVCWDAWREPDLTETVRHLAALGSTRVLVAPVAHPFESLETLLEMPAAIKQARTPDDVHVVQLPPWRDDTVIAEEVARVIEDAAREIDKERRVDRDGEPTID